MSEKNILGEHMRREFDAEVRCAFAGLPKTEQVAVLLRFESLNDWFLQRAIAVNIESILNTVRGTRVSSPGFGASLSKSVIADAKRLRIMNEQQKLWFGSC